VNLHADFTGPSGVDVCWFYRFGDAQQSLNIKFWQNVDAGRILPLGPWDLHATEGPQNYQVDLVDHFKIASSKVFFKKRVDYYYKEKEEKE
ncbi:hypothetical protein ACJX0J_032338, partial [Zea mays]